MTVNKELLPCPFCGKTETLKVTTSAELVCEDQEDFNAWPHSDSVAVVCDASHPGGPGGCGAMGGFFPSEAEAIEAWNCRHDAPMKQPVARDARKICTCLGSCKGPEGLGAAWRCVMGRSGPPKLTTGTALTIPDAQIITEGSAVEQAHVAWLRYNNHNGTRPTTIHLCDSDDPGAFQVYRVAVESIEQDARLRWCYSSAMRNFVTPIYTFEEWLAHIDAAINESAKK